MDALTNLGLIKDLYQNIAIFGNDIEIIYQGEELKEILLSHNLELCRLKETPELKYLRDALNSVKHNGNQEIVVIPGIKQKFLLFTCTHDNQLIYIFGVHEKITYITIIEHDLKERVKELECLYKTSIELDTYKNFDEALENCTLLVKKAFQYPEDTFVNITIGKKIFGDTGWNPAEITDILNSKILINDTNKGEVKVLIKKNRGFLMEEQRLVDEMAGKFSEIVEKDEKTNNLEKQQKILKAKNDALLKLTEECYEKREKLRTFFHAITDKIIVIDNEFNILMSNKDEIGESGKCYNKLFNLHSPCDRCPAKFTFSSAQDSEMERPFSGLYYKHRTHPIHGIDGQVDRVLEVCSDITEQKNMEAQLIQSYKLASLGKLVAGVAHEINNPNTFILGNLKIIEESFKDIFPILDEYYSNNKDLKIARLNYDLFKENAVILMNDMINGANRTKKIVGDLRNFAKKDEDGFTDVVDLNDIIRNHLTLTQKHIKKYAQLDMDLKESLPQFKGSINKLEQVILNLTMNASEAIEHSNGIIKIKTDYDEKAKEVLLIISDNGSGMDDNTLKNIFDPFFTTKRNKGGTGLGLSITYGIIKDHKGSINVVSRLGEGTTFTIRIPL